MVWFGLEAESYDRKYSDLALFRRVMDFLPPYKRLLAIAIFTSVFMGIGNGLLPFFTSSIIERFSVSEDWNYFILVSIIIIFINLLVYGANYLFSVTSKKVIHGVVFDLRKSVNRAVLHQDLSFFDQHPTGKIVSRINSDSADFGEMAALLMEVLSSLFMFIIILIPMFLLNVYLTFIFLTVIPILLIYSMYFRKGARKWTLRGQRVLASVNAFVQESINGIQLIKTFNQEDKQYAMFLEGNNKSYKINLGRGLFLNILFPILEIFQSVVLFALLYLGSGEILQGAISPGEFYLFIQSLLIVFFPLFRLSAFWPQFQVGLSAAERLFSLIDSESKIQQTGEFDLQHTQGQISIQNLDFKYTDQWIFKDFNLNIQPGESVAIVGHTGAGKSTLANLLLRLYEFEAGQIKIDQHDIRDLSLPSLRKQIGFIPQTPFLWAGSLESNIKYGKSTATEDQILWALEKAGGADWIDHLTDGLQTDVLERGKRLSMGQRQLAVFARVLLQDPAILIMDEATSSVDPFTETRIQAAIEEIMKNRTSIIIAHRLWTVQHVDRIIVLDHGHIIEQGTHAELLTRGGHYAELYNTYFRHQSLEFMEKSKKF